MMKSGKLIALGVVGLLGLARMASASPVTYTDISADGATTYRYLVQKIIGGGSPQPHTVTADVTTGAVTIASTSVSGTLVGGELKYGSNLSLAFTADLSETAPADRSGTLDRAASARSFRGRA